MLLLQLNFVGFLWVLCYIYSQIEMGIYRFVAVSSVDVCPVVDIDVVNSLRGLESEVVVAGGSCTTEGTGCAVGQTGGFLTGQRGTLHEQFSMTICKLASLLLI